MLLTPMASRLLADMEGSHKALIEHYHPDQPLRHGFRAVYEAISAALADVADDQLIAAPTADEWSMAEVVEHVAEHDRKFLEVERHGLAHYVEHGLEHALQLWRLRTDHISPQNTGHSSASSGTLS
jgi:hypothetical protein